MREPEVQCMAEYDIFLLYWLVTCIFLMQGFAFAITYLNYGKYKKLFSCERENIVIIERFAKK